MFLTQPADITIYRSKNILQCKLSLHVSYEITLNKNSGPLKENKRKRKTMQRSSNNEYKIHDFHRSFNYSTEWISLLTKVL